jgi:hypothetical protein
MSATEEQQLEALREAGFAELPVTNLEGRRYWRRDGRTYEHQEALDALDADDQEEGERA